MRIIVFDVGNAACSVVTSPNGYGMMIDCGSHGEKSDPVDLVKSNTEWLGLNPYTTSSGENYPLGLLHITHPDEDHVRNSKNIKENLTPYLLHRTKSEEYPKDENIPDDYLTYLDKRYRGSNGEKIDWGFEINRSFSIPMEILKSEDNFKGKIKNNSSNLRYIKFNGISILFCGDIEEEGWNWLLNNDSTFVATISSGINVLIASHHGHKSGYSKALFDKIGNVDVVIHSKASEANIEGSDVSTQYSQHANGVYYKSLGNEGGVYEGKVLTTRSNGGIYIYANEELGLKLWADKASSNHRKI